MNETREYKVGKRVAAVTCSRDDDRGLILSGCDEGTTAWFAHGYSDWSDRTDRRHTPGGNLVVDIRCPKFMRIAFDRYLLDMHKEAGHRVGVLGGVVGCWSCGRELDRSGARPGLIAANQYA